MKRIYLVDDHPMVREGLAQVLGAEPDLEIVGQAETGPQAHRGVSATNPHLVVVDLQLRKSDGLDLIKDLLQLDPEIRILVLTMHAEPYYAERALRAGAHGFLTKEEAGGKIISAVRRILDGGFYVSEDLSSELLKRLMGGSRQGTDPAERLSDRELRVFELIGEGKGTKEIAQHLNLSSKTIETYRANIKDKLSLKDGPDLVRFAIRWSIERQGPRD